MPVAPPTTVNVRYMVHDVDAAMHIRNISASRSLKRRTCVRRRNAWIVAAIAKRTDQLGRAAHCLMALVPNLVAGTASILLWMIFRARSHDCVPPARSSALSGPGGSQILLRDPSDNLIELFRLAHR
jgi:hypothetical protein